MTINLYQNHSFVISDVLGEKYKKLHGKSIAEHFRRVLFVQFHFAGADFWNITEEEWKCFFDAHTDEEIKKEFETYIKDELDIYEYISKVI